ncbi:AfaD family invasin [Vibrio cholerae]|uniref:AfaD family invasin n=2 Tax=Vibrio cholerae TaxID=666 RepID=UPI00374FC54F
MNYGQCVNKITGPAHYLGNLLLCFLACFTPNVFADTVIQLSMAQLDVSDLKDGELIGRGRIICSEESSGFKVWIATQHLAPDQQSYILSSVESQQTRLQIRLQGHLWQSTLPLDNGIFRSRSESSAVFDIVAHGEQKIQPGIYPLRVSGACL